MSAFLKIWSSGVFWRLTHISALNEYRVGSSGVCSIHRISATLILIRVRGPYMTNFASHCPWGIMWRSWVSMCCTGKFDIFTFA
uniref:Uncharacterized protein n=1 Tax=Human betaherpesvirus 6 TaxID=10368 RepID=A0A5P9V342_9BETA|nr:hypothetical protein [Human betaherpesvirus 6]QFX28753.1 hypothetical protein [Human betaherpesvirus 6]